MIPGSPSNGASPTAGLSFLCFGELLWDLFPDGPELGGSSANVAVNLHRLGSKALLVSRVGRDALGDTAVRALSELGLDTRFIQRDASAPTGSVEVCIVAGEPKFRIASESAWDHIAVRPEQFALIEQVSGIVYGTLAQRTSLVKGALRELLEARPSHCFALCDLNLRPPYYDRSTVHDVLQLANIVKLNAIELARIAQLFDTREPVRTIFENYDARLIAVTRGKDGCALYSRFEHVEHPGFPRLGSGGDSVGAGDAFTAALAVEFALGSPLDVIAQKANDHARRVASARGGFGFVP